MPMDPKKLGALRSSKSSESSGSVSKLAAAKKKIAPPVEDEEEDDLEEADEEFDDGAEEAVGNEEPEVPSEEESEAMDEAAEGEDTGMPAPTGTKNPSIAIPALEQYASEVEACCDELDYDMLTDPELEMSDDDIAIMQEGVLMLPPRFVKVIEHLAGIDIDAAMAIGQHLEEEGMVDDGERTAGWIFRVGQLLEQSSEDGESEEEPVEEEVEEEEPEYEEEAV